MYLLIRRGYVDKDVSGVLTACRGMYKLGKHAKIKKIVIKIVMVKK